MAGESAEVGVLALDDPTVSLAASIGGCVAVLSGLARSPRAGCCALTSAIAHSPITMSVIDIPALVFISDSCQILSVS
jgi:hypothetical protein